MLLAAPNNEAMHNLNVLTRRWRLGLENGGTINQDFMFSWYITNRNDWALEGISMYLPKALKNLEDLHWVVDNTVLVLSHVCGVRWVPSLFTLEHNRVRVIYFDTSGQQYAKDEQEKHGNKNANTLMDNAILKGYLSARSDEEDALVVVHEWLCMEIEDSLANNSAMHAIGIVENIMNNQEMVRFLLSDLERRQNGRRYGGTGCRKTSSRTPSNRRQPHPRSRTGIYLDVSEHAVLC
jgi:hypothetical protein